jgi:hypothetical protein
LLRWHREKAGTIQAAHDVLKNELAGGVMPCGKFGSNAAWFRFTVLTYNDTEPVHWLASSAGATAAAGGGLRTVLS